jgi:hypothetical protein
MTSAIVLLSRRRPVAGALRAAEAPVSSFSVASAKRSAPDTRRRGEETDDR